MSIGLERPLVLGRRRQAELEIVNIVFHTMRLMFAGFVTASVPYDQDRRRRMDLDVDVRVFAVSIIFSDKDGRRVELLCDVGPVICCSRWRLVSYVVVNRRRFPKRKESGQDQDAH